MSRLSQYLIAIAVTLFSTLSYGDEASFDKAVNEFLKGFRACSDANTLRATNLIEANNKFAYYRQQLDKAVAIDESILTSTERDMDKNLAYCKRVEDNLKRAEATPVLEHAFTFCEAARNSYEQGQYQQARQEFEEYRRYKEDAYAITNTLDEVFVLSSQVRSCARFEEKLIAQEKRQEQQEQMLIEAVNLYQTYQLECDSTLAYVNRPSFSINDIGTADKMLSEAQKKKKAAEAKRGGLEYAQANPDNENAIKLNALKETANVCEGQVTAAIRKAKKQLRDKQAQLQAQNNNLKKSLAKCKAAQKEVTAGNLSGATAAYNDSASLKKRAVASNAVNLAKAYPKWQESSDFNYLVRVTKSCQDEAAKSIRELKAAQEKAKEAQEKQQPAKQPEPPKEPEAAAPEEEPSNTQDESVLPAEKELDSLDDWEDDEFVDEELIGDDDEEDDDSSGHKSWTDLIK